MGIKKGLFRLLLMLMAAITVVGGILPSIGVAAAEVFKVEKTYDIAVAYDNSGSMSDNDDRWCKSKFALEIFASMLDYKNGDKLTVFPMWEVVTDGTKPPKPEYNTLNETPISVTSIEDIDKITYMYTPRPGDTPISVVTKASNYLKRSSATERWLIVLTDGDFIDDEKYPDFSDTGRKIVIPNSETKQRLLDIADDGINVQYFMVGSLEEAVNKDKIKSEPSKGLYSEYAETSGEVQKKLIDICNKIFQRDELVGKLTGDTLELDISMKSLIVFVQGEGAQVLSLKDDNGNTVEITSDSKQRKYSDYSNPGPYETDRWGNEYKPIIDTTLYGQVVSFGECAVGLYTLEYKGADKDKIKIFYEPDVDMKVSICDAATEQEIDINNTDLIAGDYIVKASLVDAKTGEDITESPLMGDVKFDLKVTYEGESSQTVPLDVEKGSPVTLKPGESIDTVVTGTYLKDYTISNEDDPGIFPQNIVVLDPEDGLVIKADVLQESNWYQLADNKNWKPVRVDLKIDGAPLTDEQLDAVSFNLKATCGGDEKKGESLKYKIELLKGESAVNIYLAQNEKGKHVDPDLGKYNLTITATVSANTGKDLTGQDKVSFDIQLLPLIAVIGLCLLGLLILALLIAMFLNQKVLPKDIEHVSTTFMKDGDTVDGLRARVKYTKKGKKGKLVIQTPAAVPMESACNATFRLEAIDKRFMKSKNRRVRITEITSQNPAVVVNNYTYEKSPANGKMIDPLQPELPGGETKPIRKDGKIVFVEIQSATSTLICKVQHK